MWLLACISKMLLQNALSALTARPQPHDEMIMWRLGACWQTF